MMDRMRVSTSRFIAALSLALFAASLPIHAVEMVYAPSGRISEVDDGWVLLTMGWAGAFVGSVAWFANPALIVGLMLLALKQTVPARWLLTGAWLVGLSAVIQMVVPFTGDEGGVSRKLLQPLLGYYLWTGSLTIAVVGAWFQTADAQQPDTEHPPPAQR